jgi:hypothetical protein
MQGAYGGLVIIINYGTGEGGAQDQNAILTEDSLPILTETSEEILTEQ